MLITKTPFRISFCGGGSDMGDYYREHGGCVLSTTINKYMYLSVHPYFNVRKTLLKYSENELVEDIHEIRHSILRCVLNDMGISGVEISSTADVPGGTGLGSSSAFTVGLLHTLHCYQGKFVSKERLAREACAVEIDKLGSPVGKQDQYSVAFGGLNFIEFFPDESVSVYPVIASPGTLGELQDHLILFYTGLTHDANAILSRQRQEISKKDKIGALSEMCSLAREMKASLEKNNLSSFGSLLNENWKLKRTLSEGVSNPLIDEMYETALRNGASGGKLLGAGGGGFMLFYCEKDKQARLKTALNREEFDFSFERDGSSVIYIGDKYWR